ncbi:MAG: 30S ribosomal protein S26e [Promethearchaeota archaeon]|nr:MAG: 30S ribosomal protein S26e [Candidatus Lokiarchaeota archaeon]
MPKKRKSGGRTKGKSGTTGRVQCSKCGRMVPIDKAKRVTVYSSPVDYRLAKELRQQGTHIPRFKHIKILCISCAVHTKRVKIRAKDDRNKKQ